MHANLFRTLDNLGVNQTNFHRVSRKVEEKTSENQEEQSKQQLTDFSNPQAEALGRSMIFKGVDDTNNDLKVLLENPQIVENSDVMFETAYKLAKEAGAQNPYEESATIATAAM